MDGVVSRFGDPIASFERTVTPTKTSSPTGKRETLVTEVPAADPNLGCLADNVRVSPLTGEPINCVPVIGTLLEDQTVSKQTGNVFGELAFPPAFPDVTPLRVARGSRLVGDALEVLVGGQVPVGFNSGDVTVEMVADATGYLFPNPTSASRTRPRTCVCSWICPPPPTMPGPTARSPRTCCMWNWWAAPSCVTACCAPTPSAWWNRACSAWRTTTVC